MGAPSRAGTGAVAGWARLLVPVPAGKPHLHQRSCRLQPGGLTEKEASHLEGGGDRVFIRVSLFSVDFPLTSKCLVGA